VGKSKDLGLTKGFLAAKKVIQNHSKEQNYMTIAFSYGTELVLPYEAGLKLLNCLEHAEEFTGEYGNRRITPLSSGAVKSSGLPRIEYENHKIAALLNVNYTEITEHMNEALLMESVKCRT
jgi:hypothetical protein